MPQREDITPLQWASVVYESHAETLAAARSIADALHEAYNSRKTEEKLIEARELAVALVGRLIGMTEGGRIIAELQVARSLLIFVDRILVANAPLPTEIGRAVNKAHEELSAVLNSMLKGIEKDDD